MFEEVKRAIWNEARGLVSALHSAVARFNCGQAVAAEMWELKTDVRCVMLGCVVTCGVVKGRIL